MIQTNRKAEVALTIRNVIAYKATATRNRPELPRGGSWDPITNVVTYPIGWKEQNTDEGFIWMSSAAFSSIDGMIQEWTVPVRLTGFGEKGEPGENGKDGKDGVDGKNGKDGVDGVDGATGPQGPAGPQGPIGPQGLTGTAGASWIARYLIGSADVRPEKPTGNNINPEGWLKASELTTPGEGQVTWCIQGAIIKPSADLSTWYLDSDGWSVPFVLGGEFVGVDDPVYAQIVYFAGVYNPDLTYTLDQQGCPYVYDTKNGLYYMMNKLGSWTGETYPSEDDTFTWIMIEGFDAILSNVGIFGLALLGSAVFNGNYMFSQQGVNIDGEISVSYQLFNAEDPMNRDNAFVPNICINFNTGEAWFARGAVHFTSDGNFTINNPDGWKSTVLSLDDSGFKVTNSLHHATSPTTIIDNKGILYSEGAFKCTVDENGITIYKGDNFHSALGYRNWKPLMRIDADNISMYDAEGNTVPAYTGTIGNAKFINGICIGSNINNV